MRITLNEPFADLRGSIGDEFYIRRSPTGRFIVQRRPRKASDKQKKMREAFVKKYEGNLWRSYVHPTYILRSATEIGGLETMDFDSVARSIY